MDAQLMAQNLFGGRLPIEALYIHSTFNKNSTLRQILHHIKYSGEKKLAFEMGQRFASRHLHSIHVDGITYVPIHPNKKQKRGFNQSEELAKGIAKSLQIPLVHALEKTTPTRSQTEFTREERWTNVAHTFAISHAFSPCRRILLVDDTLTTGATLEACGQVLLNAGVQKLSLAALGYAS